jgi:hypothetical protein
VPLFQGACDAQSGQHQPIHSKIFLILTAKLGEDVALEEDAGMHWRARDLLPLKGKPV